MAKHPIFSFWAIPIVSCFAGKNSVPCSQAYTMITKTVGTKTFYTKKTHRFGTVWCYAVDHDVLVFWRLELVSIICAVSLNFHTSLGWINQQLQVLALYRGRFPYLSGRFGIGYIWDHRSWRWWTWELTTSLLAPFSKITPRFSTSFGEINQNCRFWREDFWPHF